MSEFVRKTEQRCDPGSQSDSGAFVPRGGLGLRKIGHLHKVHRKRRDGGESNSGLEGVSKVKVGKSGVTISFKR